MFVELEKLLGNSSQPTILSNVNSSASEAPLEGNPQFQPSAIDNNATISNFNTVLIGSWTDGRTDRETKFHVMEDGAAYLVKYSEWENSGGEFVYSILYGYMDGNNFVANQHYAYNTVINGGDGIFRYSEEEVIANCLQDVGVHAYQITLEGNTITGFGDTNYQFVRDGN